MNSGHVSDVHPVLGPMAEEETTIAHVQSRLEELTRDSDKVRLLFKVGATFGFMVAVIGLLALAA